MRFLITNWYDLVVIMGLSAFYLSSENNQNAHGIIMFCRFSLSRKHETMQCKCLSQNMKVRYVYFQLVVAIKSKLSLRAGKNLKVEHLSHCHNNTMYFSYSLTGRSPEGSGQWDCQQGMCYEQQRFPSYSTLIICAGEWIIRTRGLCVAHVAFRVLV